MKLNGVVLMLFTLVLSTGMSFASAADQTNQSLADQSEIDHTANNTENIEYQNKVAHTANKTEKTVEKGFAAGGSTSEKVASTKQAAAGGSISTVQTTDSGTVTDSQMKDAAGKVKTFIEQNKRLPNYVTVAGKQLSMPQYLQLISGETIKLNGQNASLTVKYAGNAPNPYVAGKSGDIYKAEYVKIANDIVNFMNKNNRAPNFADSKLGKIGYQSLIYKYSCVVAFQMNHNRLPNFVTVKSWESLIGGSTPSEGIPSSLEKYLVATTNAQSNSSTIKNMAASITAGKTTTYAKAQAIFNWVRNNVSYAFYYNTSKGALNTLSSRSANCCDTSHLVVALSRAAGIPARYQHGTCTFSSGTYGHVWAQLYVNGKWYYADAVSVRNSFGNIVNWNLNTYTLHNTYASLPF